MQKVYVKDINGPIGYGLPAWGWYETPSAWYTSQFSAPTALAPAAASPSTSGSGCCCNQGAIMDPYGTDSSLHGFGAAPVVPLILFLLTIGGAIGGAYYASKKNKSVPLFTGIGGAAGLLVGNLAQGGSIMPAFA